MSFGITMHWPVALRSGNWKFTAFGLALATMFLGATWATLNRERMAAENQAVVNSANLARAAEEHVVATVRAIDQVLRNIAREYRGDPDLFDFQYWLRNSALMFEPTETGLGIANEHGIVFLNNLGNTGYAVSDREHFMVHRDRKIEGLFIGEPLVARGSRRSTIQFTRRLEYPDGSFAGVVAFGLDTDYFADFYKSILVGDKGAIALIGLDAIVRARLVGNNRSVGQSLRATALFQRLSSQLTGTNHVKFGTDNIERIVSYRRLENYPLIVAVGFSVDEVLGPYKIFRNEVLLGALVVSSLTLGIGIVLIAENARRQESEQLLQSVVDAAPATIQLKGTDLRVRWTNRAYLDFHGAAADSFVGKRIPEYLGDSPAARIAGAADREVLRTRRPVADIAQYHPANAHRSDRYMLVTKTPIFTPRGDLDGILTIATNITDLRHAEQTAAAAREAERAAETARAEVGRLLSGMPTAVYRGTLGAHGHMSIGFVSDNVATITGRPAEDISGPDGWYAYLGPDAQPEIAAFFARVLSAGESQTEYRLPGTNGVWIRDRARVLDRHPDCTEIVGNWTDISREHAIERQAMANAKLATLGELATGLAHELNQPIAVMSLAAENAEDALSEGEDGIPSARIRLARIVDQAQRAKSIVSHLRIFGRSDSGPMVPVRLAEAIGGALALVGNHLRNDGIAVEIDLPPDLPAVRGRLVPIESVLVNLCMNARDAMRGLPPDRRVLRIGASSVPQGRVEVRVVDRGGGIPANAMPRLFEPFFTTKAPGEGTGLGLSISHGMMQSMDGALSVANTGIGACFVLTMRVAIPEAMAGMESSASDALAFSDREA
jgi:PAS domain S-box-containing protein